MSKIAEINTRLLAEPLQQLLVEVVTEDGLKGLGECWWGIPSREEPGRTAKPIAAVVNDIFAPRLIGRDANQIEKIWHESLDYAYRYGDQGLLMMGLAGIDLALWDLLGKRLSEPVVQLIGGVVHDALPAYASLPPLRQEDVLLRETRRAIEHGFAGIKLHEVDPDLARLVRDEIGPDLALMVDVNGHFDPIEAIRVGRELESCDLLWFEEPVSPMRDFRAIKRVKDAVDVDIAAGENEYSLDNFRQLLDTGALSYLQPEITKIGGLTPARKIGALAGLHSVSLCPHNFRLGPSLLASIHWGLSSPASGWIEVPWIPEGMSFPAMSKVPVLKDGRVGLPDGVGLGYEQFI